MHDDPYTHPILAELGENLAMARKRRGWSQAELAQRIGAGRDTISRMERGYSVGTDVLASTLDLMGFASPLSRLAGYENDTHGRMIEAQRIARRQEPSL